MQEKPLIDLTSMGLNWRDGVRPENPALVPAAENPAAPLKAPKTEKSAVNPFKKKKGPEFFPK